MAFVMRIGSSIVCSRWRPHLEKAAERSQCLTEPDFILRFVPVRSGELGSDGVLPRNWES